MTLEEALKIATSNQCITRKKWKDAGSWMKLLTSSKVIEELNISLTPESLNANDWEICEIEE